MEVSKVHQKAALLSLVWLNCSAYVYVDNAFIFVFCNPIVDHNLTTQIVKKQRGGERASRECPNCHSKRNIKDGTRETVFGSVQRFLCKDCDFRFSKNPYKVYLSTRNRQLCAISREAKKLVTATETKTVAGEKPIQDAEGRILSYLIHRQNDGIKEDTIQSRHDQLFWLLHLGADLDDPETVKKAIASAKISESSKLLLAIAYDGFAKFYHIAWERPKYKQNKTLPLIPYESEIDALISGCGRKTSAFLKLLKETAMRRGEAWFLKWTDVDLKNNIVTCNNPEKNSKPRIFKVSNELMAMLDRQKRINQYVFGGYPVSAITSNFAKQRENIARKLGNPRIKEITLHTFRHWRATWLYHETKDILYVMKFLGHRDLKNTLVYIDLEIACYPNANDHFVSKVAKTEQEICSCIESGFEYVCDFQDAKIFRKRK